MALAQAGPAWLFSPADSPQQFAEAAAAADVVVLDLEDGVAPGDKDTARAALIGTPLGSCAHCGADQSRWNGGSLV